MSVEIIKSGTVLTTSRNLRGILAYARKHYVCRAAVYRTEDGAMLYLCFSDGAECRTNFKDFWVCTNFVTTRRSWQEHLQRVDCSKDMVTWFVPSSHAYAAIR